MSSRRRSRIRFSSREIYDFSKLKHTLMKGAFKFEVSKHPEAEIIDMR